MHNVSLGKFGEDAAVVYLQKKGYKIIERNFKGRYAEIDIVVEKDAVLVFVEVKTRTGDSYGMPEEALTPRKIHTLTRAAYYYQHIHQKLSTALRIDAVTVYLFPNGKVQKINHYENITG